MNIVHLQLSGGIGGISILTRDIAKYSNHNNIFYFLFEGGCVADETAQLGNTVEVRELKGKSFRYCAKEFLDFCKKQNADVIICHTGSPITRYILSYCKKRYKAKCILYLHSNANISFYSNKIKQFINAYLIKKAHKASDYTVAISQTVKDSYIKIYGFDANKTKVVFNGIEQNRFYHNEKNNDKLEIISVGRVIPAKGIHVLVKALSLIDDIDYHINILGKADDTEYLSKISDFIDRKSLNDKITLCGAKNDVENYLANADLYIHSAICDEGFGITIVEALASGVPCIAFNKGAIPEIITNGYNGFYVDEITPEALANSIREYYKLWQNGKTEALMQNAIERSKQFSIENTVKELENLY